jgi:hypothetical protein
VAADLGLLDMILIPMGSRAEACMLLVTSATALVNVRIPVSLRAKSVREITDNRWAIRARVVPERPALRTKQSKRG